jgi:D-alanine-D-alanine ligase
MIMEVNPNWWQTLFDEMYLITDARSVDDDQLTRQEVTFVEDTIDLDKTDFILDLCGGQGRHALELSRRDYQNVFVLDFSDYLVQLGNQSAKNKNIRTWFVRGDARQIGLKNAHFHLIMIMGSSFGYFIDNVQNQAILAESLRLLHPDGWLLLDLPDANYVRESFKPNTHHQAIDGMTISRSRQIDDNIIYCREKVYNRSETCLRDNCYCLRLYSQKEIAALLTASGFDSIAYYNDFMSRKAEGDYGTMTNRMVVMARKG